MESITIERTEESQELTSGASSFVCGTGARASDLVNPAAVSFETAMGSGESLPVRPLRSSLDPTARSYPWLDVSFEVLRAAPVNGSFPEITGDEWTSHQGEKQDQANLAEAKLARIPEGVGP